MHRTEFYQKILDSEIRNVVNEEIFIIATRSGKIPV